MLFVCWFVNRTAALGARYFLILCLPREDAYVREVKVRTAARGPFSGWKAALGLEDPFHP